MTQRSLFDNEPELPPWEEDDQAERLVAKIVFPTGAEGAFDYLVPDELVESVEPGVRVIVPLGRSNRQTLGYCIALTRGTAGGRRLKNIASVVDARPLLSETMLALTHWMADYYLTPLGQVLDCVLPAGVRGGAGTRLTTVLYIPQETQSQQQSAETALTEKQRHALEALRHAAEPLTSQELQKTARCSAAPIQSLLRLGLVRRRTIRRQTGPRHETVAPPRSPGHTLHADQQQALDRLTAAIRAERHETFLLHGVTGSGKTEVYIRAIAEAVRNGRQAIVLVPEISLTPQTVGRFRERFGAVAVLHSHLSDAQRHHEWMRIASGEVPVVVGARSAVFAPVPHLGLIVIDEEHENSFKQDSAPRYHARTVAKVRAERDHVPLILGSATPSLESWQAARAGVYTLLSMPQRVRNLGLPSVGTVDLRDELRTRATRGAIHRQLHTAIRESLDGGGQVILLLNRRGFSTQIQCQACGEVVQCPECSVALTHHREEAIALCHYCDYRIEAPDRCPKCGTPGMRYSGFGTQRLEQEIQSRFPDVPFLRMDTDTMRSPGSHERALTSFREGRVRILLGTQMIAKGLDFPNVTLVGVINADTALHLPDFRASERTFHLITQVAGRTGRGDKGGRVIVQTFQPDHPAIRAAARHDYHGFVEQEIILRQTLGYPPFCSMFRFVVRGTEEQRTLDFARSFAERLRRETATDDRLLGPAPAPFAKLRGFFRFHLQWHTRHPDVARQMIDRTMRDMKLPDDIQWIVDVDPLDML